jgi:small-conductance mechanosensitive channel
MEKYLQIEYLEKFGIPLLIALAVYILLLIVRKVFLVRLRKISLKTDILLDDLIVAILDQTKPFFILGVSLFVGVHFLGLSDHYYAYALKAFIVILAFQTIIWGKEGITSWAEFTILKKHNDPSVRTSLSFVSILLKFIFIILVVLVALDNLGTDVTTFIAGLGVGGIAIALATQNILGDLFSSLSIVMDKPFVIGDFISLGDWVGTIEHIGLKTTRIRSLTGEQIAISNSDLVSSRVRNFKRMKERRIVFQLGVTYQTKRENLLRAPDLLRSIIEQEEGVRFDRAHFFRYGASSLDFEIVYWVLTPDYMDYADIHQKNPLQDPSSV